MSNSGLSPAPIGVFCYNRPDHLHLTLEALGRCEGYQACPLYIFSDAPKSAQDEARVDRTRAVAQSWIVKHGGTCVVREKNMGFGNITTGVSALCAEHGRAIVVEDDIVVSPDFLTFMRIGLDKYAEEPRVFLINAFMYADAQPATPATFFLPTAFPWGWATWQRAWKQFEWRPQGYEAFLKDEQLRNRFDFDGKWRISKWLERAMEGTLDCWDPQWAYKVFISGGVGLFPARSLVWNSGIGCGVHGASDEPMFEGYDRSVHGNMKIEDFRETQLSWGWTFPSEIKTDESAYQNMVRFFQQERRRERVRTRGPWYQRFYASLRRKFKLG